MALAGSLESFYPEQSGALCDGGAHTRHLRVGVWAAIDTIY